MPRLSAFFRLLFEVCGQHHASASCGGASEEAYLSQARSPSCLAGSWRAMLLPGSGEGNASVGKRRHQHLRGRPVGHTHLVMEDGVEFLAAVLHDGGVVQVLQRFAVAARVEPL